MAAKFRMTTDYRYWWPVEINMPDPEKAGTWQTMKFQVQFRAIPESEMRTKSAEIAALTSAAEREAREHDEMLEQVCDWREVIDEDDQDVPFSKEALRQAMETPWFRTGLYRAYGRSLYRDEARKGN